MPVVTARSIMEVIDNKRTEINEYKYAIRLLSESCSNIRLDRTINGIKHQLVIAERELDSLLSKHYDTDAAQLY